MKDRKSGDESAEYFDGILICTGRHDFPNYPTNAFPGKVFVNCAAAIYYYMCFFCETVFVGVIDFTRKNEVLWCGLG